jgi:hypothetical protein
MQERETGATCVRLQIMVERIRFNVTLPNRLDDSVGGGRWQTFSALGDAL